MTHSAQTLPLRIVLSTANDPPMLCCPMCGYDCVHIGAVIVEQGHVTTIAHSDQSAALPSDRHQRARGSAVLLSLWGECGHEWTYRLSFHKGSTHIELLEGLATDQPHALWRD